MKAQNKEEKLAKQQVSQTTQLLVPMQIGSKLVTKIFLGKSLMKQLVKTPLK